MIDINYNDKFATGKTVKPYEKNTVPAYKRKYVTRYFLDDPRNKKYRDVFKECPTCHKLSFVNIDYNARSIKGRLCRMCDFYNDTAN